MTTDLLQLPTRQLLDKIGAGKHKPGSGSAAALNGILSCKLLLTVIELTVKRTKKYAHCIEEFESIKTEIATNIGPRLEILFEKDAEQFDKTIQKRKERDKENNQRIKNNINEESLQELKEATNIPIEIADYCVKLAKHSVTIFNKGFKSARGDAGVALGSALSGLTGCIAIISLNISSFPKNAWTESTQLRKADLKKSFDSLNDENVKLMNVLDQESIRKSEFLATFVEIRSSLYGKSKISYNDIENLARQIQNALWKYQDLVWTNKIINSSLEVVKPEAVIKLLHYAFHKVETLGVNDYNEDIAGIINNNDCTIKISSRYKPEVINFTTAHELGHALMHDRIELHRDLPLDGSDTESVRDIEEIQANKFAAFFLMPRKAVTEIFNHFFQTSQFSINEETARLLTNSSLYELRKQIRSKRDLSRLIAKCEYYNYNNFNSLSKIFQVSSEAMAIRLEELDLIKY